jgi:hypothetical protein
MSRREGNVRRPAILPALLLLVPGAFAAEPTKPAKPPALESSCVTCHKDLDGELQQPAVMAAEDIHFLKGLGCNDCHGGNPQAGADGDLDAAHDPKKGWSGRPHRKDIPVFCAKCHADAAFMKRFDPKARVDQLQEYRTSVHGKKNAAGDERVAVCVDCHGVHGIRAVKDPRAKVYPANVADTCARCHNDAALMGHYFIEIGQVDAYKKSVHARALYDKGDMSAPTCNDCHGSHGAVPPGVESIAGVCGTCHTREATLFRDTEAKKGIDLSACIQCVMCHSNHAVLPPTDDMLGVGDKSTCTACHAAGEPGYQAAKEMGEDVVRLTGTLREATELLDRAEQAGMAVGPDRFALKKAGDQLVESKVLAHGFDLGRFKEASTEGIKAAEAGLTAGHRAFAELRFRRKGLALSLIVIAAVIAGLAFKVRQIERGGGR